MKMLKHFLKKLFTFTTLTLITQNLYADSNNKWELRVGAEHVERQQGRITSRVHDQGYPGANDFNEDGDVTTIFTNLFYKVNQKWTLDYKYDYQYVRNNDNFGHDADKDNGAYIGHMLRVTRSFDKFDFLGKSWNSSIWVAYRFYAEPSIEDSENSENSRYKYVGYSSDRLYINANMNTILSEKTAMDLNYFYQYRSYDLDNNISTSDQIRHYITVTFDHKFNDSWYTLLSNTLYLRQQPSIDEQYGEWDYNYTLGHKYPLPKGYTLYTELTATSELGLWSKGSKQVSDHSQAEIIFMPKIKKIWEVNDELLLHFYIGGGYVLGYDARTTRKQYGGFEGRIGGVANYKF